MRVILVFVCLLFTGCSHMIEMSRTPEDGYGYMNSVVTDTHLAGKWKGGKLNGFGYIKGFNKNEQYFGTFKNGQKNGYISKYLRYKKEPFKAENITFYENGVKKGHFQENSSHSFKEGFNFSGGSFYFVKDKENRHKSLVVIKGSDRRSYRNDSSFVSEFYDYRYKRNYGSYEKSLRRCFSGSLSAGSFKDASASHVLGQGPIRGRYVGCELTNISKGEKYSLGGGLFGTNKDGILSYGFRSFHESYKKRKFYYQDKDDKKQVLEAFYSKRFGPTIEYHPDGLVRSVYYMSDKPHGYSIEYKRSRNEFSSDEIFSKGTHKLNEKLHLLIGTLTKKKSNKALLQKLEGTLKDEISYEDDIQLLNEKEVEDFFNQTPEPFGLGLFAKKEILDHHRKNPLGVSRLIKQLRPYYTFHSIQSIYKIPMSGIDLVKYKNGKEISRRKNISLKKCFRGSKVYYSSNSCDDSHKGLVVEKDLMSYKVDYNYEKKTGFVSSTYLFPYEIYGEYKKDRKEGLRYNLITSGRERYRKYQVELGNFVKDEIVGKGVVYSSSEKINKFPRRFYHGEIANGMPNGKGKVFSLSPKNYIKSGTFKNGLISGVGRSKINGVEYRGNFIDGKREGKFKTYYEGKYVDTWSYKKDRRLDKKGKCLSRVRSSKGKYSYKITPCEYRMNRRVDKAYLAQVEIERAQKRREREEEAYRRKRQKQIDAEDRQRRREKKRRKLAKKRKYQEQLEKQRNRSSRRRSSYTSSGRIDPNKFLKSRLNTSSSIYKAPKVTKGSYSYKKKPKSSYSNSSYKSSKKIKNVVKRYKDDTIEIHGTHSMFQPYETALDLAKTNARTNAHESCRNDGGTLNEKKGYLINKKCHPNKSGKEYKCSAKMNFWCTIRVQ